MPPHIDVPAGGPLDDALDDALAGGPLDDALAGPLDDALAGGPLDDALAGGPLHVDALAGRPAKRPRFSRHDANHIAHARNTRLLAQAQHRCEATRASAALANKKLDAVATLVHALF